MSLAIETSQRRGGVAVCDRNGRINEANLASGRGHDDQLLPTIDQLLRKASMRPHELERIAVSIGPGGLTGLRIALATAQVMAEVTGAVVIGVPSALSAAYGTDRTGRMLVALAARGESFWATALERDEPDGEWRLAQAHAAGLPENPMLLDASALNVNAYNLVLADEFLPAEARARCEAGSCPIIAPRFTAGQCLRAIESSLVHPEDSPLNLLPIYPRPPEAVSLWEQRNRHRS